MSAQPFISSAQFDGFLWIKCIGRGSFANSPQFKQIADQRIAAGERVVVLDLAECSAMDSTFMGVIAGIARQVIPGGGKVQVISGGERIRDLLGGLGLDSILEIDPPDAIWLHDIESYRSRLQPPTSENSKERNARMILDAHIELSQLNEKNANQFKSVIELFNEEVNKNSHP